ncbi:MAG: hypothetical protein WCD86_04405 [Ktedonobacteraceae bacterium]
MTLTIEREDKKPEPRAKEIQRNWKAWAGANGFIQKSTERVDAGTIRVLLEVWEHLQGECLIYMPLIPQTKGGDVLYITEQEHLSSFLEDIKKLVIAALVMVQVKQEQQEERARMN